ncbi:MAG: hypothetical protein VXZ39_04210, partial [Planctomycetota bacterium]|nr:hypothetical protein [Planctomycetota bacterium]
LELVLPPPALQLAVKAGTEGVAVDVSNPAGVPGVIAVAVAHSSPWAKATPERTRPAVRRREQERGFMGSEEGKG